jgi:hydrogenase nickel incorporation protein HypA/HybF
MHELSVTEQLLDITLEHARKANAQRVLRINLVIGDLSAFVGESIQFYFDILSKGTNAESASLSISRIPARARCRQCQNEFTPKGTDWVCPQCGGFIEEVISGREFYVESIEVE